MLVEALAEDVDAFIDEAIASAEVVAARDVKDDPDACVVLAFAVVVVVAISSPVPAST